MANLQDQLGLGLAVKQTQKMNNNKNYSFEETDPLTGGVKLSAGVALPSKMDLGGGPSYSIGTGGTPQVQSTKSVSPSMQSFSASSGVSAPSSSTNIGIGDTFSGITPKRDKNIAQSAGQVGTIPPIGGVPTVPVSPTLDINRQQRLANIASRQGVAGIQTPITPTTPEISPTGLQGAELQAYNLLTPQEQKTFQALATQGLKAQTDYLHQSKANQEYIKSQETLNQQVETNRDQAEDIQARQQLESAARQVANLKQNIGYIGTGGQPGVSSAKLDAVGQQVALANKTYDDVVKIDQLNKANRQLGQESHALQFTRQMTQLQDDLDSKVNKQIQGALNQFNAAELKGKLDTIPEIEAFQQQLYAQLDGDLSSIMDTNIEARKFLIDRYDKLAESQKSQMVAQQKAQADYEKNKNSINKEMSAARGYFVNDNGEPVIDQQTGARIVVPPETTTNYDASSGQLIMITKNPDGTVGVQMKQVGTGKPTDDWSIQSVDDGQGGKMSVRYNKNTNEIQPIGSIGSTTGDLRGLASQYPGQAWAKNNNPAGITWNSNFDQGKGTAGLLQQAGIQYSKGTERPPNEGGNYVTFNTIEDGLKAQQIMMTQTYGNSTVGQMLSSWVGTSEGPNYAKQVAGMAGVDPNTKVSQLSPEQLSTLQMAKIQKESPGLAKLLHGGKQQTQTGGLADDINVKVANIGNIAFGRTMSDTEGKRVESIIKKNPTATVNDIALAVRGLNIAKEEDKPLALDYVSVFDKMSDNVKPKTGLEMTISKYINSGDYKGLNDYVSKHVENDVKATTPADTYIPTSVINTGTKNINEIISLINKNKDKLGLVDGNFTKLKKKFVGDADIQKLQTLMTGTFADLRKNFAGSAVTSTELKALADYIAGDVTEVPENLVTKLETLRDMQKESYDQQRSMYGIPNTNVVQSQKKLGITGGLKDFMSELTTLLQ